MLQAACTACGKQYRFADEYAGKSAKCPACGGAIQIPRSGDVPVGEVVSPFSPPLQDLRKTSGMAVAALCLGVAAIMTCDILFPLAIVGLILGIVALNKIDNPVNGLKGRGLAQAGAIVSGAALVMIIPLMLMIGIMLPALGAARRTAHQMQNSTQLRGIQQGDILYSQGNSTWYAGLTNTGTLAPPVSGPYSATSPGVGSNGFAALLNGSFFTPGYLVAPSDSNSAITPLSGSGVVTVDHYSYAVSQVTDSPGDRGRHDEWKDNANDRAVVFCDRALDQGAEAALGAGVPAPQQRSIWTSTNGDWRGGVVLGDNSVQFQTTSELTQTHYGTTTNAQDNLFQNDGADPSANAFQVRN